MNIFSNGINSIFEEPQEKLSESQQIHRENERNNLLTITRLVLRSFLEQSVRTNNRVIESDIQPLCDLLMMIEKILWHGFKSTAQKSVIFLKAPDADLWSMIGRISKSSDPMRETVSCVDQIDSIRTPICKIRAFLRIALMQKRLSDFFTEISQSSHMKDYYESWALLRQETVIHVAGGLMGLKVLDCNLSLNNDRLQDVPLSVDLSPYIKLPTVAMEQQGNGEVEVFFSGDEEKKRLLDQNSYLEERVRQLTCNLENLKKKRVDSTDSNSIKSGLDLGNGIISFRALEESNSGHEESFNDERTDLLRQISEKEDSIRLIQQQLTDTKALNADLYLKLRHAEDCCRRLEEDFRIEKQKHYAEQEKATLTYESLSKKVESLEEELKRKHTNNEFVQSELYKKNDQYTDMNRKLEVKQEELSRALNESQKAQQTLYKLQKEVENLTGIKEDYEELKKKYGDVRQRAEDAESALEDMGGKLSESKLRMIELAEELLPLSEAQWAKDEDIHTCTSCSEKFTLSRRKHHCRMCGSIFCSNCTEGRVKLPSSAKPARVCNKCYTLLGNRQNTHPLM